MSTPNVTCDLCGGTNFYCEEGFYYCSECQRQTQDIQEHVFEEPEEFTNVKKTKRIQKKNKDEKQEERVTSWECYNYILLGLVKELIELGASENLKTTIEVLWFKYLKQLEVVGKDVPPKLQAYNSGIDAEIIYGRKTTKQKRRRSRSTSPSSNTDISTLDTVSLKRERLKQKKALAKAEYLEIASTTQQSETSLLNQSLTSLKGSSEPTSKDPQKFLQYHRTASKELKRKMTKNHFREHCRDVNSILNCHKPSSRMVSRTYVESPVVLSRSKLFSIIYLGLLINKESIQLGDMLRYIREGYLSYEYCNHFFPEEFIEKQLNVCTFNHGNHPLLSAGTRICSLKMAAFLNVKKYIPVQNLFELCERFCTELNLPDEIRKLVVNLLSRSEPKMSIYDSGKSIPNYEARAMSLIIFVLKLYFCLDDETEFEYSSLAEAINQNFKTNDCNMFNFEKWLKHIEYRKIILAEHHFPTTYLDDNYSSPDNFIGFISKVKEKKVDDDDLPLEIQLIKNVLESIQKSFPDYSPQKFSFSHSLTPFRDYLKHLLNSSTLNEKNYFMNLLNLDCSSMSIEFLNHMESYMKSLLPKKSLIDKHGGKNDNVKILNLFDKETERFRTMRIEKKIVKVTFAKSDKNAKIVSHDKPPPKRFKENPETILSNFERDHLKIYKQNKLKRSKTKKNIKTSATTKINPENVHINNTIYNSSERVWLNLQNITDFTIEEGQTFLKNLPLSFRLIMKECARIIEQTEKELFIEYTLVEAYLCYIFNVKTGKHYKEKIVNSELSKLLDNAKKLW